MSVMWSVIGWQSVVYFKENHLYTLSRVGGDLYLCCRVRLAGYPVRALGTSGYRHRVGQSVGGGKTAGGRLAKFYCRRVLSERNKTFVMVMTYPARSCWRCCSI